MGRRSLQEVGVDERDLLSSCFSCYHQYMVGLVCHACGGYHLDPVEDGCPLHFSAPERCGCMVCHRTGSGLQARCFGDGAEELFVIWDVCVAVDELAHRALYADMDDLF